VSNGSGNLNLLHLYLLPKDMARALRSAQG
jgi:hypothetical protein